MVTRTRKRGPGVEWAAAWDNNRQQGNDDEEDDDNKVKASCVDSFVAVVCP